MQRFQESDRPDILVRRPHFRRGWKVSAIRELQARSFTILIGDQLLMRKEESKIFPPVFSKFWEKSDETCLH